MKHVVHEALKMPPRKYQEILFIYVLLLIVDYDICSLISLEYFTTIHETDFFLLLDFDSNFIFYFLLFEVFILFFSIFSYLPLHFFIAGFATLILQYRVTLFAIPLVPIMEKLVVTPGKKYFGEQFGAKKD